MPPGKTDRKAQFSKIWVVGRGVPKSAKDLRSERPLLARMGAKIKKYDWAEAISRNQNDDWGVIRIPQLHFELHNLIVLIRTFKF